MAGAIEIQGDMKFKHRLMQINWGLIVLITVLACVGFTALYSAAGGDISRWALKQMVRYGVCIVGMLVIALIDVRLWHRLAYACYGLGILLLIAVEIKGHIGMGAQRWIDLGVMKVQPSELMKIAVIMALARYFHAASIEDMKRLTFLIIPAAIIAVPVGLVMLQPDLGTSLMIVLAGAAMFWIAGASKWLFITGGAAGAAAIPVAWLYVLHPYQKKRVMTFLNPESDPLGDGYHITQSKIALGSGGIEGKGFMKGTQSHLNFLPEKQTDFIFTLWSEEWGLLGGLFILVLCGMIFLYAGWIAFRCRHDFGRLMAFGLMVNFSLYILINIAMVMGLLPVVGVPLPLVSYGGTAMLAVMIGFGLIISCNIYRDSKLPRI